MTTDGPLLRVFEVRTKEGCAETLLEDFATTSADAGPQFGVIECGYSRRHFRLSK